MAKVHFGTELSGREESHETPSHWECHRGSITIYTHTHKNMLRLWCVCIRQNDGSLWITMMIRTALLCSAHTKAHIIYYRISLQCVDGSGFAWTVVIKCHKKEGLITILHSILKCRNICMKKVFAIIHFNLHMDDRVTDFVTDLLRGFRASPFIRRRLDLGGQNWPWPAGTKQSVLSLHVCVCSH